MMFSYRLVRLIETHADALAGGLEERVQTSSQVSHFRTIPPHELRERVYEIYRHLGEWLLGKNELDIEHRYRQIGTRRAHQGIPLSEVVQAIVLTKENLWEFLKSEAVMDRAVEIMGTGTAECWRCSSIVPFTTLRWVTKRKWHGCNARVK